MPSTRNRTGEGRTSVNAVPINSVPESDESSGVIETHPLNSAAMQRPEGYWNEDSLSVTDWEIPAKRVVLPAHLRHVLGDDTPPVLRWARRKYQAVVGKHVRDLPVISRLSTYLDGWQYVGIEPGHQVRRVLFQDESQRWYSASLGRYRTGSYNVVTVFEDQIRSFWQIDFGEWRAL